MNLKKIFGVEMQRMADPKHSPMPTYDDSEFVPNPGESDSTILKIKKLFNY